MADETRAFRLVDPETGRPRDRRMWTQHNHAALALRATWAGYVIQEGTVTWPTLPLESKESTRELVQLALPLEHEDLGLDAAP